MTESNRIDITRELYPQLEFLSTEEDNLVYMDKEERKLVLSKIARSRVYNNNGSPMLAVNISSIQELNKMENVYRTEAQGGNTQINIMIPGQDAAQLMQGLQQRVLQVIERKQDCVV